MIQWLIFSEKKKCCSRQFIFSMKNCNKKIEGNKEALFLDNAKGIVNIN